MTSDVDLTQAHDLDRTIASDPDPYIAAVLNLWPPESDSDPGRPILWRGALAIAIAGVATLVLLSVVIFESGHRPLPRSGSRSDCRWFYSPRQLLGLVPATSIEPASRTPEGTRASPGAGGVSRTGNAGLYRDRRSHKFSNGGHDANASLSR